ncbi:methionine/alanine import family NSS transporter small subunit [Pseudoclavibacter helvolus]|uniref:methionine/alanine import family NSS transporter small subunit n=1 Tax=Pseudoclavibacter helvolus TaxID=255205 RepID=UPI0009ED1A86|nr:methionine/alanine import family NSS transporter small subunit [Pseudoclavibacter helvolus]
MTPEAITMLIIAIGIVWGGCAASVIALRRRPERADYPAGGHDDGRAEQAPVIHDT